ncbi:unnamed protein product [Nezara viridula]|uniref:Glucose-methanol-choline oxidoreductase N-terminal domain-containing protein n=1 Tax=Nezara viridula TaxID=85310 RepID=A0A9P0MS57_NEZVI|nr:unnamed protein product [Nezara viridula]
MVFNSSAEFFTAFLCALQTYFPQQLDPNLRTPTVPQAEVTREYDFVIVGAGSAGCVLANRLSENSDWTVLLIEAGGKDDHISDTPFLADFLLNTEKDWNYNTIKQEGACLNKGGICSIHRGKVIGGSSTINDMFYGRGNKEDYEEWKRLGNEGWGYDDVLPYFKKAENMTEPCIAISGYHGTRGPMNVQFSKYRTPLRDRYTKAAEEVGWKLADYNGKNQSVIGYQQTTINGALRESASKAYLNPIRNRKNLHIILESVVSKIIIEGRVSKGVEYFRGGETYKVFVKKDVILSAGTVETPKLLMLSGIGPRKELEKHKIDTIVDLPVGSNYIDHENVEVFFKLPEDSPAITQMDWKTNESVTAFAKRKGGPLTMPACAAEAVSFFNPIQPGDPPLVMMTFCSNANIEPQEVKNGSLIKVILSNLRPNSVGNITLNSNNFREPPLIQPNMLNDETGRKTLELGIKKLFKVMEANIFLQYCPELYTENVQAKCSGMKDEDYIKCVILQYSFPGQHCVGTAKMGPENKEDTVVSSDNLTVKGIKGLRVVDGSVIPTIPRGSTNAVIIMVAEKAADIIKNYYKRNESEESSTINNSNNTEESSTTNNSNKTEESSTTNNPNKTEESSTTESKQGESSDKPKQSNFINMFQQIINPYKP